MVKESNGMSKISMLKNQTFARAGLDSVNNYESVNDKSCFEFPKTDRLSGIPNGTLYQQQHSTKNQNKENLGDYKNTQGGQSSLSMRAKAEGFQTINSH